MITLECPNCNGELELPDDMDVAHCLYCGTKIKVQDSKAIDKKEAIERYIELAKVAIKAENHEEAIEYCNKILELNSKNVDAWINKAEETFWLTTEADNRFDEAISYLEKASSISPDDVSIKEARDRITKLQALWLNKLGIDKFERAKKVYRTWAGDGISRLSIEGVIDQAENISKAKKRSSDYFIEAMNYYLHASRIEPRDRVILDNIALCAKHADWLEWHKVDEFEERMKIRKLWRAKIEADEKLPKLKERLGNLERQLEKLQAKTGFIAGAKIKLLKNKINNIKAEMEPLEKSVMFQPPQ